MKKKDLLQEQIGQILTDIDFICQYQNVSVSFRKNNSEFQYTSNQILQIGKEAGVTFRQYEGDQYFSDFEIMSGTKFRIGMTIKYNIIEFDLTIKNDSHNISSGGSFGLLVQLLTNWQTRIKKPGFNNYEEMKNLIQEGIAIYRNVCEAVIENLPQEA